MSMTGSRADCSHRRRGGPGQVVFNWVQLGEAYPIVGCQIGRCADTGANLSWGRHAHCGANWVIWGRAKCE